MPTIRSPLAVYVFYPDREDLKVTQPLVVVLIADDQESKFINKLFAIPCVLISNLFGLNLHDLEFISV